MVYSMSGFVESSIILQNIIMFIMEICLILALILLIFRIMSLVEKKKILVSAAELFFSFLFMTGLLNDHRCSMGDKRYKPLFRLFPADIMLVLVILLTVYLIRALYRELKEYRNALSPWSVHEAVNNVPCGVCVSDPLGRIVLSNKKMRELGRKLTGEALQNYEDLKIVLGGGKIISGITKLSEESSVFYLSDNTVWMFQEYMLSESELEGYIQTVAFDISEIYYNSEKIRMNNEKLEVLNKKLKKMYAQIDDSIREQETLKMKMQVHDSFGRSLLTIRRMLESHKETDHMENQLEILKQSVYILSGITQDDPDKQYQETIRHAQKLGVSVEIEGEICEEAKVALITDKAIRECVTNCIRHAHGSKVYVQSYKILEGWKIRITNDGENPKEGSKEGGGLSALREAVEREGGQMITRFAPRFLLVLELPLGGTED